VSNSIQFGGPDGRAVISNDGVSISKAINTPGEVLADNMRGNSRLQVRTPGFASFNTGSSEPATQGSGYTSVNMALVSNGSDGILASLTRDGNKISASEARPTDHVILPGGVETDLRTAVRQGYINMTAAGEVSNPTPTQLKEADGSAQAERDKAAGADAEGRG
jgi:hypothetical protein